jgi:hypothetical protein
VDGTLIEAWASQKSFRRKDGKGKPPGPAGEVDFHREKRKNQTHESTTDRDARLFRKSQGSEAKLGYLGHVLMENRNGLLVQTFLTEAHGRAERDAAMLMVEAIPSGKRVTLAGDKNYDTREFVRELRGMNITPHVAQNDTSRRSAVDQRTTRHAGYEVSQRKRVEQSFGWSPFSDRAALALPDVLTAGAWDRLRGMFLFQLLPTNWTISVPHISYLFFLLRLGLLTKISLVGWGSPVCPDKHKSKYVSFCTDVPLWTRYSAQDGVRRRTRSHFVMCFGLRQQIQYILASSRRV